MLLVHRLRDSTPEAWEEALTPTLEKLRSMLPTGTHIEPDGSRRHIEITWQDGVQTHTILSEISDLTGSSPNYANGDRYEWIGVKATLRRTHSPAAHGYALLAALQNPCPDCDPGAEAHWYSHSGALEQDHPEKLGNHPTAQMLQVLGKSDEEITHLAEHLHAVLGEDLREALRTSHRNGHLPGLLQSLSNL